MQANRKEMTSSNNHPRAPVNNIVDIITRISRVEVNMMNFDNPRTSYSQSRSNFQGTVREKENMIEEIQLNGQVVGIRISVMNRPEISFNLRNERHYAGLKKLDIRCPVALAWVFDFTSRLQQLQYLRFGVGFFEKSECYEHLVKKIENSPAVKKLIIIFDKAGFDKMDSFEKSKSIEKLDVLMDLCAKYLTGMTEVDLQLPDGPSLDSFLKKVPHLLLNGELHYILRNKMVHYYTSVTPIKPSTNKRPDQQEANVGCKKTKQESGPKFETIDLPDE